DPGRRGDAGRLADLPGTGTANTVDALQPDPDMLLGRQVDAGNTRHGAALQTWRPGTGPGKVGTLVSELEILTGSRVLWKPRAPRRPGPGMGSVPMLRRRPGTGQAWRKPALPGPRATLARGSVPGHPCARPPPGSPILPSADGRGRWAALPLAALQIRFLQQAVVLVRHQVRLDLRNEVHHHDHHDQQRGAAEVERCAHLRPHDDGE